MYLVSISAVRSGCSSWKDFCQSDVPVMLSTNASLLLLVLRPFSAMGSILMVSAIRESPDKLKFMIISVTAFRLKIVSKSEKYTWLGPYGSMKKKVA